MAAQVVLVELYYDAGAGAAWQDITDYVRTEDGIRTQVGQQDEAGQPVPSSMSLVLNTEGIWRPYDPTSPVYGRVGRNTPIRLRVAGSYRFVGEVARWDLVAPDGVAPERTPVEAAGLLRRLSQGAKPLASAPRRYIEGSTSPVAYWPMEDVQGAAAFAPSIGGTPVPVPLGIDAGTDTDAFPASNALPVLDGPVTFPVPTAVGTATLYSIRFLLLVPSGTSAGTVASFALSGGSFGRIDLNYSTASGGTISPVAYDPAGSVLTMAVAGWTGVDDSPLLVTVYQTANGATNAPWFHRYDTVSRDGFVSSGTAYGNTNTGRTRGALTSVTIGSTVATGVVLGHLAMYSEAAPLPTDAIAGFAGETADARAVRIGSEAGVDVGASSSSPAAAAMGVQRPGAAIDLLREVAASDGGLLYDSHLAGQVVYRATASMYNQHEVIALTAYQSDIRAPLAPVVDDQATRNDVEVANRHTGAVRRAVATSGPLSVQDFPAGVGRYDVAADVNVQLDTRAGDHAAMLVHRGTVAAPRYPRVTLELSHADASLLAAVQAISPGNMVQLVAPPGSGGADVYVLVLGWSEQIGSSTRRITLVCAPADPYTVVRLGNGTYGRLAPTSLSLAAGVTSSATSWSVAWGAGEPGVASSAAPFGAEVAGEVVTVTAVAGTSSPQTWTVARSVNGVSKPHVSGAALAVALQPRLAI